MSNRKEMITFEVQRMTTEAYRNFSKKTKMNIGKKIADTSGQALKGSIEFQADTKSPFLEDLGVLDDNI